MKKRVGFFLIAVSLILCIFATSSCSSGSNAPELESVKDRFIYLIEESKEINTIFFGAGLPVYKRESLLADQKGVYYSDEYTSYDVVMENSGYFSTEQIKIKAEEIYSKKYLSSLYESAFDGVLVSNSSAYLRFYETDNNFYQNTYATDFKLSERIYDYSTMEIAEPSDAEYVNISINSYSLENKKTEKVYLSFICDNGVWYLDSPTY